MPGPSCGSRGWAGSGSTRPTRAARTTATSACVRARRTGCCADPWSRRRRPRPKLMEVAVAVQQSEPIGFAAAPRPGIGLPGAVTRRCDMTYCVGLLLNRGSCCCPTPAPMPGSTTSPPTARCSCSKSPASGWSCILTAGSLSVTQTTMARLAEAIEDDDQATRSIMHADTMLEVAEIVGDDAGRRDRGRVGEDGADEPEGHRLDDRRRAARAAG